MISIFFFNIEYAITWLKFDHSGLDYPDFSINGIRFYGPIFYEYKLVTIEIRNNFFPSYKAHVLNQC